MGRRDDYRSGLRELPSAHLAAYLHEHSGLQGARANLELAQAVADELAIDGFDELLSSDDEYLMLCGTIGLGRLLAESDDPVIEQRLRVLATDNRWRVREGVALALQRLGDTDLPRLLRLAARWGQDRDALVQRAAVAGVCEPRLLASVTASMAAAELCDTVTRSLVARPIEERSSDPVRVLRRALGYCWSVAVAADPAAGLPLFHALTKSEDPDVGWIVRENRKKSRLAKLL